MLLVTLPLNILLAEADGSSTAHDAVGAVTIVQLFVIGLGMSIGVVCALSDTRLATRWRLLVLASYLPVVVFATLLVDS